MSDYGVCPLEVLGNGPHWHAEVTNDEVLGPLDKLDSPDNIQLLRKFLLARGDTSPAEVRNSFLTLNMKDLGTFKNMAVSKSL